MHPDFAPAQRGFGLVAALFLILVIAGVIAAMARLAATQHSTSSLALQQARAYQAARAGLGWGISQFVNQKTCAMSLELFALDAFEVTVQFIPRLPEAGVVFCTVWATAEYSSPGSPDHVHRKLEAVLEEDAP